MNAEHDRPGSHRGLPTVEYIERRLRLLAHINNADRAWQGRIDLVFEVLEAIASGGAKSPDSVAAALLKRLTPADLREKRKPPPPSADPVATILTEADKLIAEITIDQPVLDYLYHRTRTQIPQPQWEGAVRTATAIHTAMESFPRGKLPWEQLADAKTLNDTFGRLAKPPDDSSGVVLLSFHGAFVIAAQQLFRKRCRNGAMVGPKTLITATERLFDNPRDVMFAALRLLQDGGVILIGPDGLQRRQSRPLQVLGAVSREGAGAAFLAHASRSRTAWYTVVRDGERFAPVIEFGPQPDAGEKLQDFSDRINAFYASKIEEIFTGDPGNISLLRHWTDPLLQAAQSNLTGLSAEHDCG